MTAYEIQLWYVIRDKIQSETKSSLTQNSVQEKILDFCFVRKKNCQKLFLSQMLSRISSVQSELSRTNRCLSISGFQVSVTSILNFSSGCFPWSACFHIFHVTICFYMSVAKCLSNPCIWRLFACGHK